MCAFGSSLTPAFAHTDAFPMQTGNDLSHVIPHPLGGGGGIPFYTKRQPGVAHLELPGTPGFCSDSFDVRLLL